MRKTWVFTGYKPKNAKITKEIKNEIERKGWELIRSFLIPEYIKPVPPQNQFNYLVDIFCKWHGKYFYFFSKYASPPPNAIEPFFAMGFARMGYVGKNRFNLSFMRHTGKWCELFQNIPLEECFDLIKQGDFFNP